MKKKRNNKTQGFRFLGRMGSTMPAWNNPLLEILLYAAVTFLATAGPLLCLVTGYNTPVDVELILLLTAGLSLFFSALYRSSAGQWVFYVTVLLLFVVGLYAWEELWAELATLWNASLPSLQPQLALMFILPEELPLYESGGPLLLALSYFLCMTCGYSVNRNPRLLPVFLFTFPLIEIVFLPGLAPAFLPLAMSVCGYGCVLAISRTAGSVHFDRTGHVQGKAGRMRARPLPRVFAPAVLTVCALTLCGLLLSQAFLSMGGYTRPEALDQMRAAAMTADLRSLFYNPDRVRGRLSAAGDKTFDHKTDLAVTLPMPAETVYLRGFTAGVYKNGNWEQLPDGAYTQAPFSTLAEQGKEFIDDSQYYPENTLLEKAMYQYGGWGNKNGRLQFLDEQGDVVLEFPEDARFRKVDGTIQVEPVRAGRQYAYLPYMSYKSDDIEYEYDRYARLKGGDSYEASFTNVQNYVSEGFLNEGRLTNPFAQTYMYNVGFDPFYNDFWQPRVEASTEGSYRAFVNAHYLEVPAGFERLTADVQERWESEEYGEPWSWDYSLLELRNSVREYLYAQASYSLTPGTTPPGEDPINYMLYENHKGYCMHFASAATIIFRAMGIPARYTEGYVITQKDIKSAKPAADGLEMNIPEDDGAAVLWSDEQMQPVRMELKDTNSHAWVEVYADGFGWVPIEVTPGYSGYMEELPTVKPELGKTSQASRSSSGSSSKPKSSSAPSSKPPSSSSSSRQPESGKKGNAGWLWFVLLGLVILTGAAVPVVRRLTLQRRMRLTSTPDVNQNILHGYEYLVLLLANERVEDAETICYHPEDLHTAFPLLVEEDCESCMTVVLKARFSGQPGDRAGQQALTRLTETLKGALYGRKSVWGKFVMKYIKMLL